MSRTDSSINHEEKEEAKLEQYRTAVKDARHVFNTYKNTHPDDAWECLRRILFNKALK